jgi:alpha-glucosidase (family GH31 glycosyl hydrolase)
MTRRLLTSLIALTTLFAGASCDDQEEPVDPLHVVVSSSQARVRITLEPFRVEVFDGAGQGILTSLADQGTEQSALAATLDAPDYRSQIVPGWDGYEANYSAWRRALHGRVTARDGASASIDVEGEGVLVHYDVSVVDARVSLRMRAEPTAGAGAVNVTSMAFESPSDEHFFGMGERFATSNHRGYSLYSWAEEGGLARGEKYPISQQTPYPNGPSMTYFPVPFFLSTRGYGVHLATTYRTQIHFASERPDAWRATANTTEVEAVVYVHDDPLATLDDYTRDTGRPVEPTPWVFGLRRRVDVNAKVGDVLEYELMRQKKIPCTTIDDAVHFLPASSQIGHEADLKAWTDAVHQRGYKVVAYNNPYVASDDPNAAQDYAYGVAHDLFVKRPDGSPSLTFFISGKGLNIATVDLTNPAAVTWFQGLLKRTLDTGYDGWMHDFGEYIPHDAVLFDGRRGDAFHNEFPVLSAKAAHDLMERERPGNYMYFVRSGGAGTQAFTPAVWGGDAEATFDESQGLPSALRSGINLGMSGVPYWGSDMTGYKCLTSDPHDKDIFLRWIEVGAVSPIMEEENACSNPIAADKPVKWSIWNDDETTAAYRRWAGFHTRLQPYFLALARRAARHGTPLMMHPYLMHPHEPGGYNVDDAFWLGAALYAAPVVHRALTARTLWLPPGRFVDLDDGRAYDGGASITVDAPLEKLPIFLAQDQILPLLDPGIDTLGSTSDPSVITPERVADRLDVLVALGAAGKATLTLTDGTTLTAERLPGDRGNPAALAAVSQDAVADCASCYSSSTRQGLARTQATSPNAAASDLTIGDLHLSHSGGLARRIRWDVTHL